MTHVVEGSTLVGMLNTLYDAKSMSNDPETPEDKFRAQRHEFILHYYDMSVQDLSRHLGIGWQSLALVAGAVVVISLAEKNELPAPIAVVIALVAAFWGLLNVLDASYWATRAIAFLANVEALYCYDEDRTVFNPYLGRHPPYKLLDSLRYQFLAIAAFIAILVVYFVYKLAQKAGALNLFGSWELDSMQYVLWVLPPLAVLWGVVLVLRANVTRIEGYHHFVTTSPGPGMMRTRGQARDLLTAGAAAETGILKGEEIQKELRESLAAAKTRNERAAKIAFWVVIGVTAIAVGTLLLDPVT